MIQLREFARSIVESDTLQGKLASPPENLGDTEPGETLILREPGRSTALKVLPATAPIIGMRDKNQRRRILHAMTNHELQAIELFAWALLAFPDAPTDFRRWILAILKEEQRHFRLYQARIHANDAEFGEVSMCDAYVSNITKPLSPARARARTFDVKGRRAAGLSEEFIGNLEQTIPQSPGGRNRV